MSYKTRGLFEIVTQLYTSDISNSITESKTFFYMHLNSMHQAETRVIGSVIALLLADGYARPALAT